MEYLLITVRNYISSLKLNSYSLENDLIVFRFVSLCQAMLSLNLDHIKIFKTISYRVCPKFFSNFFKLLSELNFNESRFTSPSN